MRVLFGVVCSMCGVMCCVACVFMCDASARGGDAVAAAWHLT